MKTRRTDSNAVDTQFDEWAKAVAHGMTRRKILQVLGGGFTGALVALRGPKAWATPRPGTKGCGHVCAPLFNRRDQTNFEACTQACEDCKSCQGTPALSTTSPQVLVCTGATPCRSASGVACCGTGQNGQPLQTCCNNACCTGTCCGSVCCSTGMDCCLGNPPQVCYGACTPPFERDPNTCQCMCPTGTTLCNGTCVGSCPAGQVLNTQTCTCIPPGPDSLGCFCKDSTSFTVCVQVDCFSSAAQDAICGPICASHGGEQGTACLTNGC